MTKKTFKNLANPAMAFISQESEERVAVENDEPAVAHTAHTASPRRAFRSSRVETKSRRLQLLLQPSLHEKLRARAEVECISVNELVNSILREALTEE